LAPPAIFGLTNSTRQGQTKQGRQYIPLLLIPSLTITHPREEFTRHGMSDVVTLTHRNVCKDGFTVIDTVDSGKIILLFFLRPVFLKFSFRQFSLIFPHPGTLSIMPKGLYAWVGPNISDITLINNTLPLERSDQPNMLLQSMHGASSTNCQCIKRCRFHRYVQSLPLLRKTKDRLDCEQK
jgi:hypothetical protein